MRIAFTGAHKVGKTTLVESLADSLQEYDFTSEPYVRLEELGYSFSETPTADDYIQQFNYSVKQIETGGSDVLLDRCPLDLLAYVYATDKTWNIKTYYQEMIKAMARIDLLVFVPIESPDLILCQQSDLPGLRTEVNELVQNWIEDLSNEILEVTGTLENRKKQILERIYKEAYVKSGDKKYC